MDDFRMISLNIANGRGEGRETIYYGLKNKDNVHMSFETCCMGVNLNIEYKTAEFLAGRDIS